MFDNMISPASSSASSSGCSPTAYHKPKFFTDFSIRALIGSDETCTKLQSPTNYHHAISTSTSSASSSPLAAQTTPLVGQDLRTKMATLTIDNAPQQIQTGASSCARKYRPKNFQCPACKMAFSNNGQLRTHVRIHTGERPFRCNHPDCNKTFTRNEELTRHKLIHTGVRPHSCNTCGKRFGRKDHLKKHIKTHERRSIGRKDVFVPTHSTAAAFINHQEADAIFVFKDKLRKALEAQVNLEEFGM